MPPKRNEWRATKHFAWVDEIGGSLIFSFTFADAWKIGKSQRGGRNISVAVVSVVFWKRLIPICFFFSKKKATFSKFLHHFSCPTQELQKTPKGKKLFFCATKGKMQKAIDARLQGGGSDWGCCRAFNIQELDVGRLHLLYCPKKKHGSKKGMFSPRWL